MPRFCAGSLAVALVLVLGQPSSAQEDTRNVLVFGDSLTWGWNPNESLVPVERHAPQDRWTAALEQGLGAGHEIIVEGLSGRTTNIDDPYDAKLNGAEYLPAAVASHEPLDLVIIMLGTNDTKTYLDRTPLEIALGAGELINIVHEEPNWDSTDYETPEVLLISPPPLAKTIHPDAAQDFTDASREKSQALPQYYAAIAEMAGEHFFDAGTVIATAGVDGIHFTAEANATLGAAVAEEVQRILAE